MLLESIGFTKVAGESLTQLDWPAIAALIGTGIGAAITVVLGYRKIKAEPAAAADVILPTASIANMRWGPEAVDQLKEISACLKTHHAFMVRWREDDEDRREKERIEAEAFRRGQKWQQDQTPPRPGQRRRPDAD